MPLNSLLAESGWDAPFYKVLAPNDTGAARGHQGGMVIPKELRGFFPGLVGTTSSSSPTLDHRITALLYVDDRFVGIANTRYQFQTWGGGRSPESRLTDKLGPLRNGASGGDILIVQRGLDNLEKYRLLLVTKKNPAFEDIQSRTHGKKWGLLTGERPLSIEDLAVAEREESTKEHAAFELIDSAASTVESRSMKIARSIVFRKTILRIYENKCCICGEGLAIPDGGIEVHAAHIVPRAIMGTDDARNGLCLCTRHHWAFDNGLFGIDAVRKIFVPAQVLNMPQNKPLAAYHGKRIVEAVDRTLMAAPQALGWHMENVLLGKAR